MKKAQKLKETTNYDCIPSQAKENVYNPPPITMCLCLSSFIP